MQDEEPQFMSTLELVKMAQAGDRRAFTLLVDRYKYRLNSLVYLRLGCDLLRQVEPQDILQEVWMRAYQSIRRFRWRGKNSFFHWLGGIADHVVQDLVRRRVHTRGGRRRVMDQLQVEHDGLPILEGTTPSKAMRRDERFERLSKALDRLSEDHREVIILARIRGLPIQEIAEVMGRTRGAVSALLLRALRELKARFGGTDSLHLPARSLDSEGVEPP
jgi:RNA polymerase sigma-70 factor (ECF subfamily)